jgi:tetratricopeptide (TPR) repeat protein
MKQMAALFFSLFLAGTLYAVGSGGGGGGMSSGNGGSATPAAVKSAQDWYDEGYAASQAEDYRKAVRSFRKAISLDRQYAQAYNMLGFSLRKLGRIKEALSSYEKALKLKPDFPEAREYYGEAHLQNGNLEGALEQYRILEQSGSEEAQELMAKIEEYKNAQL